MVHGNAVFIREKAKLARNTHRYTFSRETSLFPIPLTSLSIKQTTPLAAEIIFSHDYDVMQGAFPIKAGIYAELKASRFLND